MQPLFSKSVPISIHAGRSPFLALQNEISRAMNDFYNVMEFPRISLERFENVNITPAIDIIDSKESFKLEVEMPGMDENDIKISIGDGMLTIKGEKSISKKDKDKNYMMREISYGYYERSIPLPESVEPAQAKASFKKGMLWVDIPKKAESSKQYRELQIQKAAEK